METMERKKKEQQDRLRAQEKKVMQQLRETCVPIVAVAGTGNLTLVRPPGLLCVIRLDLKC